MAREWPLVAFTLLGQMAVGIYLFVGGPLFLSGQPLGWVAGQRLLAFVMLAVLGLTVMAAALSILHLHRPLRAFRVLSNIRSSWLSREIFFELVFMAASAFLAVSVWGGIGGRGFIRGIYIFGAMAGILFILSMARLYMLEGIPAWNRFSTLIAFVLTALVLGSQASLAFFSAISETAGFLQALVAVAFLLVTASLANVLLLAPPYGVLGGKLGLSMRPHGGSAIMLRVMRSVFALAGAAALAVVFFAPAKRAEQGAGRPVEFAVLTVAFVLVLAGETIGRFMFYGLGSLTWLRANGKNL